MSRHTRTEFSRRLKQALLEAGYAPEAGPELARLFGVSPQAVRKWLNAEAMPKSTRAPDIATELGVRRAWLMDGELPVRAIRPEISEDDPDYDTGSGGESISRQEFRLLLNYRALPARLRKSIDSLLENMSRDQTDKAGSHSPEN